MLEPLRSQYHVGPELTKIGDTAGSGTEHCRVAHQQLAGKRSWPRLQQSIKGRAAALRERVRGRRKIYDLSSKHPHLGSSQTDTLKLRQMRVKIESVDALQQAEHVEGTIDLGRRRRPVERRSGSQAEAIVDWHAERGYIENTYRLQIMNESEHPRRFRLEVAGLPGLGVASESVIEVPAADSRAVAVRLRVPSDSARPGSSPIRFFVREDAAGSSRSAEVIERSVFLVPL